MQTVEERITTLEKQLADITAKGRILHLDEPQCDMLRKVMDAHIIHCLRNDNEIEALMAHRIYLDVWGYLSWEAFHNLAALAKERSKQ